MELKCSKCNRTFQGNSEATTICPQCVEAEFSGFSQGAVDKTFRAEAEASMEETMRKQRARAEMMNQSYNSGKNFTSAGRVNLIVAIFLLIICIFGFLLNDPSKARTAVISLDDTMMQIFSMTFCGLAAIFTFNASMKHKKQVRLIALGLLVLGWYMPAIAAMFKGKTSDSEEQQGPPAENKIISAPVVKGRFLSEEDLTELRLLRSRSNRASYAIFVNEADPMHRKNIGEAIARLVTASHRSFRSKKKGFLYIVETETSQMQDITPIAARFGDIYYSNPEEGIYEVNYSADSEAKMTNTYTPQAISTASHPSFVAANILELRSMIPQRVQQAAKVLAGANTPVSRTDVVDAIYDVLRDPWQTEPQVYADLVKTLVIYSAPNNDRTAEECLKLFNFNVKTGFQTPTIIVDYLLKARGKSMTDTILALWVENPLVWGDKLTLLGDDAETKMLAMLKDTRELQLIGNIIKHFQYHGSKKVIPALQELEQHKDSLVSRAATEAIKQINTR